MSKVVFVGNVPYNMGEEQLIDVFKTVGHVVGFRLVFDRDTGKAKGYGFCEFADHETALSAVRNLNNVEIGGRPLRIDIADSDPFLEGKTTVRGEILDDRPYDRGHRDGGHGYRDNYRERDRDRDGGRDGGHGRMSSRTVPNAFLSSLPPGVPVAPGTTSLDAISRELATMNPAQLIEVLAQMKAFVITHPEQARILLVNHPQLAYALFQALLLTKIVDQSILQRMLAATVPSVPPQTSSVPYQQPHSSHQPAPSTMGMPQPNVPPPPQNPSFRQHTPIQPPAAAQVPPPYYQQQPPYGQPPQIMPPHPPVPTSTTPTVPAAAPAGLVGINIDPAQKAMLLQVLSLTPEQIAALPPTERDAIQQLKNQFMGAALS